MAKSQAANPEALPDSGGAQPGASRKIGGKSSHLGLSGEECSLVALGVNGASSVRKAHDLGICEIAASFP